jgi:hypothetical protein
LISVAKLFMRKRSPLTTVILGVAASTGRTSPQHRERQQLDQRYQVLPRNGPRVVTTTTRLHANKKLQIFIQTFKSKECEAAKTALQSKKAKNLTPGGNRTHDPANPWHWR